MCSVHIKRKLNSVDSGDEPQTVDHGKRRKNIGRSTGKGTDPFVSVERAQLTPQQRRSLGLHNIESVSTTPVSAERNPLRIREAVTGPRNTFGTPLGRNSPRPGTPLSRRSAAPEEEVTAVYTECIKLSAANKINSKNAFGLRLIDCMSHLIRQKPNEKINFKLVSSALDAGAKIYGHRVDCVQAEAQKVASGLVIALDKDKSKEGQDNEGDLDGDEVNDDGETRPKRRKVGRKTVKTIATNIESLNTAKVECNTPPDPLFSLLSSSFDVGNVNGLLMSNLCLNEDGLLLLNPTEITSTDSQTHDVKLDRSLIDGILNQRPQIVPQLSKFEFLSRGEDLDNSISTLRAGTQTQDKLSFALDGGISHSQPFEASLEPLDNDDHHDPGGFFDHDSVRSDGEDDGLEKTVIENNYSQSLNNQYLMRTVDSDGFDKLVKALSDEPSEYTYFNKELLGVWAGPEHWKLNPLAKRGAKKTQALAAPKSARKPKNQFSEIDFKQTLPVEEDGSTDTQLKFSTLSNWTERLLPSDVSYEPIRLIKPFLKEGTTFSILRRTGIDPNQGDEPSIMNDNCSDGRSSPGLDAGMDNHYDDEFPPTQECFSTQAFSAPFSGDNLVDEPFAVSSTALPFSTHAKKIDVKRLKQEMWTIVTSDIVNKTPESSQNKEPSANNDQEPSTESTANLSSSDNVESSEMCHSDSLEQDLTFSNMYKKLPDRVGTSMANNLSVPIAFVALLHLTNEKNLQLQGKPDLSDFIITPESMECS